MSRSGEHARCLALLTLGHADEDELAIARAHALECEQCASFVDLDEAGDEAIRSARTAHIPVSVIARWARLQAELPRSEWELVRGHVDTCLDCTRLVRMQESFKRATTADNQTQLRAPRRWKDLALGGYAIAASIMIAVLGFHTWELQHPPRHATAPSPQSGPAGSPRLQLFVPAALPLDTRGSQETAAHLASIDSIAGTRVLVALRELPPSWTSAPTEIVATIGDGRAEPLTFTTVADGAIGATRDGLIAITLATPMPADTTIFLRLNTQAPGRTPAEIVLPLHIARRK